MQTVEAMILLSDDSDFSKIGVVTDGPHFITAGSKGQGLANKYCEVCKEWEL